MTYLYIITLHSAAPAANTLIEADKFMTPGTDVWVDTRQKPFPRTETGLVESLVGNWFAGTKEVANLQILRKDPKPSDKAFHGVRLVKCETLDKGIPVALKEYYENILKIYPGEWNPARLEVRVKICEIAEDQDLSSIVGVGSIDLKADGLGRIKYKSSFAEPNFQESRIDEFIEYMGEIRRFNDKKDKFMKITKEDSVPVEAFEPESKFAEEYETIQEPASVKKPQTFPEMNLRCKWKAASVEAKGGIGKYFSRPEPEIRDDFKEFTLFGGELSKYLGSAFCPEFEVEEIKDKIDPLVKLKALLSSKLPMLKKSDLEAALACFPEPLPAALEASEGTPLDEVVDEAIDGASTSPPAPPTEMDAYFEHMFTNVFLPEFVNIDTRLEASSDVLERNHMILRIAWLLFVLCPKESFLSRLEPFQDTYMGKKPLPSWFSLNDSLFTAASEYFKKHMESTSSSKFYEIKNIAALNHSLWTIRGDYFEWKGNNNAWDAVLRLYLMPQTMNDEQKKIILKSFCENRVTASEDETTGSQTMYQSFLEWLKKPYLYTEERLKRIKGVILIGEFSRLMKENGFSMTRRSTGMVYLKTALKGGNTAAAPEKKDATLLPAFNSDAGDVLDGFNQETSFESVEFKDSNKKIAKTTEELLAMFNEREAEAKTILKEQEARILKNA